MGGGVVLIPVLTLLGVDIKHAIAVSIVSVIATSSGSASAYVRDHLTNLKVAMGHGIAQVFALAGHDVTIYDSIAASLDTVKTRILTNLKDLGDDQKAVERVTPVSDLAQAVRDAEYVVEAVLEDLPLKQKLFAEIEGYIRPDTILASNTSVIPITRIMEGLKQRERALGTHWWNPPYLVPLVEVIETQWTSRPAIDFTMWGTLAGGIILGVSQAIGAQIDPGWQLLAGHIVFLAILAVRPHGFFPKVSG